MGPMGWKIAKIKLILVSTGKFASTDGPKKGYEMDFVEPRIAIRRAIVKVLETIFMDFTMQLIASIINVNIATTASGMEKNAQRKKNFSIDNVKKNVLYSIGISPARLPANQE